jgi:hypothetical protein
VVRSVPTFSGSCVDDDALGATILTTHFWIHVVLVIRPIRREAVLPVLKPTAANVSRRCLSCPENFPVHVNHPLRHLDRLFVGLFRYFGLVFLFVVARREQRYEQ